MGQVMKRKTRNEKNQLITEYHQIDYLPADPSCMTITVFEGKPFYGPLLGWQVATSFVFEQETVVFVSPVTNDGVEDDVYVLFPDGTVRWHEEIYENVEEWLPYAIEQEKSKRAAYERKEAARKYEREVAKAKRELDSPAKATLEQLAELKRERDKKENGE